MPRYQKRPVVIESDIYSKGMEDGFAVVFDPECFYDGGIHVAAAFPNTDLTSDNFSFEHLQEEALGCMEYLDDLRPYINTLEGRMFISEGDYIITGVEGERYPCKPDIFEKTYERLWY